MRRFAVFTAVVALSAFATPIQAQNNSLAEALESPFRAEAEPYAAGPTIPCSLTLPASASLFGTDHRAGIFIVNELFSPFRVFAYDETCTVLSTWSNVGVAGVTTTGIGFSNSAGTYWLCDPFGGATIAEYTTGTGIPTGFSVPTPIGGSVWGALVVDDNQPGEVLCISEIALDATFCIDMTMGGAFNCSYPSQEIGGGFGNGISDAVAPADCSGQTLVNASGPVAAGRATRAGQYDCTGNDPACTDRWDLSVAGFANGICEFQSIGGDRNLMLVDNLISVVYRLALPCDITSCQDIDANMNLVWINGSLGGIDFKVNVPVAATLSVGIQRTPAGNGRFVHHMNAGTPSATTVAPLFDLGNHCFPFLGGSPVVIENNLGRTSLIGASKYFTNPIPDPATAPTFLSSLTQPVIDTINLPAGSQFTHQVAAVNGAASSSKGGSLSNGVVLEMN